MSNQFPQAKVVRVASVDSETVVKSAEYLIDEYGNQTDNLRAVFQAGCSSADYSGSVHFQESELTANETIFTERSDDLHEYYGRLTRATFVDENGNLIQPCSTINLFDAKNDRLLFIAVAWPGINVVYYEKYPSSGAGHYAVNLVTDRDNDRIKAVNHMEPYWSHGNIHDLVTMSQMFGFPYDKTCDEAIILPGRVESSFKANKIFGMSSLKIIQEWFTSKYQ